MTNTPIDSIMFDVDGTIWDSTFVIADAWNKDLVEVGLSDIVLTAAQLKQEFGKPLDVIGEDLLQGVSAETIAKILPMWVHSQMTCLNLDPPPLYEGLEEALKILSQKYKLFVISNSREGYIEELFRLTGIGKYFVDHVCNGDTGLPKDGNIRYITKKHNLKRPIYVGDVYGDYDSTRKAGCEFVYAAYGFGEVNEYEYRIEKPIDLLSLGL